MALAALFSLLVVKTVSIYIINKQVRAKRLPDMIVAGVEKCGTGALRWMLLRHPMMMSSNLAEMHYFGKEEKQGIDWYL